tara:strand:+ start:113 stop:760 length:648 start_codon:yes stop_codon:yes gene_type:complete
MTVGSLGIIIMEKPSFKRRKESRPAEITAAAIEEFSLNGYESTRIIDIARRANISKGLLYLYFKTKEELFKSVIRGFISPRIEELRTSIEESNLSAEKFLRGPYLNLIQQIPKSKIKIIVRLMIAEGPKHPDLVTYYWENVVSKGLTLLRRIINKGIRDGEFNETCLEKFPQLLFSPVVLSVIWTIIFKNQQDLDTDTMLEAHVNLLIDAITVNK